MKLYNEELLNFYCSPSIIRIIKSRRMRWTENITLILGEEEYIFDIGGNDKKKEKTGKTKT
jgi:hypothetical protein